MYVKHVAMYTIRLLAILITVSNLEPLLKLYQMTGYVHFADSEKTSLFQ